MTTIQDQAGMQRRFGFVSILWWIGFAGAAFDAVQNNHWSGLRLVWIAVSLGLAAFFTYTWWKLKKGQAFR